VGSPDLRQSPYQSEDLKDRLCDKSSTIVNYHAHR
jgi:hypothetical protein